VFPQAGSPAVTGPQWSDCARKGLAVKAVRGNALLFYSLKPNGCAPLQRSVLQAGYCLL